MQATDVRQAGQALAYITNCTLATVCTMALKKSRPKYEFERQVEIAQRAIDWMKLMDIDFSTTRAAEVVALGSVQAWAETFMPEKKKAVLQGESKNEA